MPTVTLSGLWVVAGCAMPPPTAGDGPCVTAQFVTSVVRITSNGQALLLFTSQSICAATRTQVQLTATHTRVTGT
jgi:hypothetical protein